MGKLFTFQGRGSRGRLWLGVLASFVLMFAPILLTAAFIGATAAETTGETAAPNAADLVMSLMVAVMVILALVVQLATGVTRCHDRGKSGFWMLLTLVPLVGFIWWLVDLGILEGTEGPNKYGPPIPA